MRTKVTEAAEWIRSNYPSPPRIGLILGSGLGAYGESLNNRVTVPFSDIPNFPQSTVLGHSGNLLLGDVDGVTVAVLQGRVHFYEGYSMAEVSFPSRVLGCLGIKDLIVTNAAGGVNLSFKPGDLMLITDHINLMGGNPLIGPNCEAWGCRFPDMSEAYDRELRGLALKTGEHARIELRQGVYVGLAGPSYETPAEIKMLRILGGDAVGMSTIPEVIVANHMGIRVLGISCITNMAAGILPRKLTHQEVMDTTERVKERFLSLLNGVIAGIASLRGSEAASQ